MFIEGSRGDAFYILVEGQLKMTKIVGADKRQHILSRHHPYQERPWFGEISLWTGGARTATATCVEWSKLLVVRANMFRTFLHICPTFKDLFSASTDAMRVLDELSVAEAAQTDFARISFAVRTAKKAARALKTNVVRHKIMRINYATEDNP